MEIGVSRPGLPDQLRCDLVVNGIACRLRSACCSSDFFEFKFVMNTINRGNWCENLA